jgi:sRNA-binding protein
LPEDALENAARRRAADAALLALARSHARAYVVTRNSHVEAIETYLRVHGVARPNVRRVMPGESKGPTIARALEEERLRAGEDVDVDAPSVFVDDDVREILREDVRAMRGRLTCVVFTRDAS